MERSGQYSSAKILAIWAAAAGPMGVLGWIVTPLVGDSWGMEIGLSRAILLTLGLVWLTVFALLLVRHEEGDLAWTTVKRRLRLNPPLDPTTGERRRRLWWWLVPLSLVFAIDGLLLQRTIGDLVTSGPLSFLAEPDEYSLDGLANDESRLAALEGAWWLFAIFVPLSFFNIIGEEFLFRGILLPRMEGVFGRLAWLPNGLLFALYHVALPWAIPTLLVTEPLFFSLPAMRFRSTTLTIILHAMQVPFVLLLVLGVVLGVV